MLGLGGRVGRCGVQHAPHLPVPMAAASGAFAAELAREAGPIRGLAPEVGISIPPGRPNTAAAILFAAAALRADPAAGRQFARSPHGSFWIAADLSDRAALMRLADGAGLGEVRPGKDVVAVVAAWRSPGGNELTGEHRRSWMQRVSLRPRLAAQRASASSAWLTSASASAF